MSNKHSIGPWRAHKHTAGGGCWFVQTAETPACHVVAAGLSEANARLIAAAPELVTWIWNMATDDQLDQPMPAIGGLTGRQLLTRIEGGSR